VPRWRGWSDGGETVNATRTKSHREAGTSWDDGPFRRVYRNEQGRLVDIPDFDAADWYDVTSLDDPCDVHVYVRLNFKP